MRRRNSIVDHCPVTLMDGIGGSRVVQERLRVLRSNTMAFQVLVGKIGDGDRGEIFCSQAKSETAMHRFLGESEANTRRETSRRRQWRPGAMRAVKLPADPGRSPDGIRRPAPTPAAVIEPASV